MTKQSETTPDAETRPWWRRILCSVKSLGPGCGCRPWRDANGCGGRCVKCGQVFGYVTYPELRRYIEREEANGRL